MSLDNGTIKRGGSEHNTFPKNQQAEHFDSPEWGELTAAFRERTR